MSVWNKPIYWLIRQKHVKSFSIPLITEDNEGRPKVVNLLRIPHTSGGGPSVELE